MAALQEYRSDGWTHQKHWPVAENQSVARSGRDQKVKMEIQTALDVEPTERQTRGGR